MGRCLESGSEKVRGSSYLAERGDHSGTRRRRNYESQTLRAKVQTAEDELRQLGFELDDEGVLDSTFSSSRLARTIERRLVAEVGTKDEVLTRSVDRARIKLLLVASAEEADKIVEPLLNFEVAVK